MEELNIIIEPELEFSLKRCGDIVPYGITPEEKAKLAGIEENANNYIHPEKHPSSILDVVDVVDGAANKFLNERGEMVAVAHESLTDKNSEAAFQHVDTETVKPALDAADMVAIKDSVTGKMVLTPKSNFDETFKKLAVRRGAVFNEATGFYELNGLTDITEDQMMDIYNYTSQAILNNDLTEYFVSSAIRTTYNPSTSTSVILRAAFNSSKLEVLKTGSYTSSARYCFQNCTFLKTVDYLFLSGTADSSYLGMFSGCTSLVTCFLRTINVNISLQWSPLLSLESLQYIIQYRNNGTKQITITVHPTVFAKLTDNVNYPTWYAVAQDALTKYITFATA